MRFPKIGSTLQNFPLPALKTATGAAPVKSKAEQVVNGAGTGVLKNTMPLPTAKVLPKVPVKPSVPVTKEPPAARVKKECGKLMEMAKQRKDLIKPISLVALAVIACLGVKLLVSSGGEMPQEVLPDQSHPFTNNSNSCNPVVPFVGEMTQEVLPPNPLANVDIPSNPPFLDIPPISSESQPALPSQPLPLTEHSISKVESVPADKTGKTYSRLVKIVQGCIKTPDGTIFEGDLLTWQSNVYDFGIRRKSYALPHGNVTAIYPNGSRFEGEMVLGKRQGAGVLRFVAGGEYSGDFSADKYHGKGSWKTSYITEEAEWRNGQQQGEVKMKGMISGAECSVDSERSSIIACPKLWLEAAASTASTTMNKLKNKLPF